VGDLPALTGFSASDSFGLRPRGLGGQAVAVPGGPVAVVYTVCQCSAQGQARGRCRTRRRPVVAILAGTLMILRRRVAHRAAAMSAATAVARARLNAMTAQATQAALAAYRLDVIWSPPQRVHEVNAAVRGGLEVRGGLGHQPARPRRGGRIPAAQPRPGDHRGRGRGRDRRELDVQPPHPRIPDRGALLGVPVDLADRVIHVKERDPLPMGPREQARDLPGQPGQQPGADRVELLHVPVRE